MLELLVSGGDLSKSSWLKTALPLTDKVKLLGTEKKDDFFRIFLHPGQYLNQNQVTTGLKSSYYAYINTIME